MPTLVPDAAVLGVRPTDVAASLLDVLGHVGPLRPLVSLVRSEGSEVHALLVGLVGPARPWQLVLALAVLVGMLVGGALLGALVTRR